MVEPLKPGATKTEVFFLNEGTEGVTFEPPETVTASLPDVEEPVVMRAPGQDPLFLPPGGFLKLIYTQSAWVTRADASVAHPSAGPRENSAGSASAGFLDNLERLEPIYVIYGDGEDSVKFQLSFAVRLYENDAGTRVRFGYTQTMLWAVEDPSGPVRATTYSPQLSFTHPVRIAGQPIEFTVGVIHDSTGLAGPGSRDVNRIFLRSAARIPLGDRWSFKVAPSVFTYFATTGLGADDIGDYWGNGSLEFAVEQEKGFRLSGLFRGSFDTGKGAAEINASYPMKTIWAPLPRLYLFGQLFAGYGESLLGYRGEHTRFRFGVAFTR